MKTALLARASRSSAQIRHLLEVLLIALVFVTAWHFFVILSEVPPYMLPGPKAVFERLVSQWAFLMGHAYITAVETLLGFVIGVSAGAFLAIVMAFSPLLCRVIQPPITASQSLPVFAIAPLLVLWFGFGLGSKIIMAVLVIFFSVTSTFHDGLRRTSPELLDLGGLHRLSRWQILRFIRIPAAMPSLASGIRIAAVFAPIGAIVGEWVGAKGGLAFIMLQSNARMQTATMFAALLILAVMVLLLRYMAEKLTRLIVPWQDITN
ncbi:ABC transporter permease [Polycladidibacter stylochi]|uniref:ABC transporter permease n=1 Tax=Polycladidibacter stylochi TaxID=1807766 RepID=UPI000A5B9776|nr:ABC transporter permease [Pseudovibrio stylochi]